MVFVINFLLKTPLKFVYNTNNQEETMQIKEFQISKKNIGAQIFLAKAVFA